MEELSFTMEATEDGGYTAVLRGTVDAAGIGAFWDRILSERPEGGFAFGVLDIRDTVIPHLAQWPVTAETLELLHPVARMFVQSQHPGFRMALVSHERVLDDVIEDLIGLVRYTPLAPGGKEASAARRFTTLQAGLAWCRREAEG